MARKSGPNRLGEIGGGIDGLRFLINQTLFFERGERKGAINDATFVKQFIALAVQEHSPVPRLNLPLLGLDIGQANVRGAVVGDLVVKLRPFMQPIEPIEVSQEKSARMFRGNSDAIEKNIFAFPVIRAQPDDVPLVRRDVDQFILSVKPGDNGVALSHGLSRLD